MAGTHIFLIAVLFFGGAVKINGSNNQGRLLKPEEGCGMQDTSFLMQYHDTWPWVGSLVTKYFLKVSPTNCTATLITSRHAITSAQCSNDLPLFLRLGENPKDNSKPFMDYAVAQFYAHPEAKAFEVKNNIAILFLGQNVEFSDRIRPACLSPWPILERRVSEIYRLVRENPSDVSKAAVYKPKNCTHVDTTLCGLFHSSPLLDETTLCAYGNDALGNKGDPFIAKIMGRNGATPIYQIGLDVINAHLHPGIFLNIQPYVHWINTTITGTTRATEV